MLNKKERMEKLNNAGVNTGKYFTLDLPDGLRPGAKISLVIDDNGNPMVVTDNYTKENTIFADDYVANQIIEDGYVRNTKLHRRFVMAQVFQMLNYVSWDGRYRGYNDCLKRNYGYDYTLKMMLEEVNVLSKLEVRDRESFEERSHFFTKNVVIAVMEDYLEKLKKHVDGLAVHKCKGVPYKKVKGKNIFVDDLNKKIYFPIQNDIRRMKYAKNYTEMHRILKSFMNGMIKLPYDTPKSKVWIDAYKGEGAFYTLKNLAMFHDCAVPVYGTNKVVRGIEAVDYLKVVLDEYKGEGYKMFALMNRVIEYNKFDFYKRLKEIYNIES